MGDVIELPALKLRRPVKSMQAFRKTVMHAVQVGRTHEPAVDAVKIKLDKKLSSAVHVWYHHGFIIQPHSVHSRCDPH